MALMDSAPVPAAARRTQCTDDRYEQLRRPCPTCGELGARIVYGYPSRVLLVAARRGQVVLGGCTHGSATHQCTHGHRWDDPTSPRH